MRWPCLSVWCFGAGYGGRGVCWWAYPLFWLSKRFATMWTISSLLGSYLESNCELFFASSMSSARALGCSAVLSRRPEKVSNKTPALPLV